MDSLSNLDLALNQLSGPIPSELGDLNNLYTLDIFNNKLSGPIPEELGSLNHLHRLWIQSNQLSGEIPSSLKVIESFRFCNNQLTGSLPTHLRAATTDFSGDMDDITSCYGGMFSDDDGSVHEIYIEQAAEWGITQGCADGRFCPSRTVTRAQMASFLTRAIVFDEVLQPLMEIG